jgi:hypothetical protein
MTNQKDYNKKYYSRPDIKSSHSLYMKKYYKKHRDSILKKQCIYYVDNKERIKNYMKIYMRTYKKSNNTKISKNTADYKKSDGFKLRKDMVDPESEVVDVLDSDEVGSVTDDDSSK